MQGGVHLLSGLVLASLTKRKEFKLGAVLGAILPDFDIIITAFAYLAIGERAGEYHRNFSHSLLFIAIVSLIIISLSFIPYIKKKTDYDFLGLGLGIGLGYLTHLFLDMLYLGKILLLWPYDKPIGFPIVPNEAFNPSIPLDALKLKLIQTTDFYTDIFLFCIPVLFLAYKMDVHKKIRLPYLIYIIVDFLVITFFIIFAFNTGISYEDHVVYLYIPGTFFLLISIISPILFRNVIRDFKFEPWILVIILALLIFSQFLFYV